MYLTYLRCFCITLGETVVVNIIEAIAGYQSIWSSLLIMLTELTFYCKSSMNISINSRYYNRFIHLRRPIFSVNHNSTYLCLQSRPHLESRTRLSVLHSRGTGHSICDLSVRSSLLDSSMLLLFHQPIMSPIIVFTSSLTCLLVQTLLQPI